MSATMGPLTGGELRAVLTVALKRWADSSEELRDLDAAVGDGDLGITVRSGCDAAAAQLTSLADPTPAAVVKTTGAAFANANPSTMAALVGAALLAGAETLGGSRTLGTAEATALLRAGIDSISTRGKAQLGDKTILDALVPSLAALEADTPNTPPLRRMIDAAQRGIEQTRQLQSRRGRAAWVGERAVGHPDPGATAYLRFLQALETVAKAASSPTEPHSRPAGIRNSH